MTADADYYEVLGVGRHASVDDIRRRYRRLMQKDAHHPDLGGDTETAALINRAYSILTDPGLREDYDARLDVLSYIALGTTGGIETSRSLDPSRECVFCGTPHGCVTIDDPESSCTTCGSPLCRVSADRLERWDQRAIARIPRYLPVRYFTDWRQADALAGRIEDLSLNGLRLVSRCAVCPGHPIRLVSNVLEAVGHVVRSAPRRTGWRTEHVAGVAFATLRMARTVGGFVSDRV